MLELPDRAAGRLADEAHPDKRRWQRDGVLDLDAAFAEAGIGDGDAVDPRTFAAGVFAAIAHWWAALTPFAKFLVQLAAYAAMSYVSGLLYRPPPSAGARSYGWSAPRENTGGLGSAVPVLYGGPHRVWPIPIMAYIDTVDGDDWLYWLGAISEGPIESAADLEVNDQAEGRFKKLDYWIRLGTPVQDPIPGFADVRNTYGVGVVLDTDGDSFIYTTSVPVDTWQVRIRFPAGQRNGQKVTFRVEYRDAAAGGAWTELLTDDVEKTRSDAFPVMYRFQPGRGGAFGAKHPSAVAASGAGAAWTTPDSARLSDNIRATISNLNGPSQFLDFTGFAMGLPAGAVPIGMEVEVEGFGGLLAGEAIYSTVQPIVGGVPAGANRGGAFPMPKAEQFTTFGGPRDLWDLAAFTQAEANAADFGVRIGITGEDTFGSYPPVFLDSVRVRIHYQTAAGDAPGRTQYDIQVTRVNSKKVDGEKAHATFDSVDEIVYSDETYPNVAVVGVKIKATGQLSGGTPTFSVLAKGRLLRRLSLVGGVYVLSAAESWSDSPYEAAIDALTNARYGAGAPDSRILLSSFGAAHDYAQEIVADPVDDGGDQRRFALALYCDEQRAFREWIEVMLATCRSYLPETDRLWKVVVDKPEEVTQVFTDANLIRDSFETSAVSILEEHDQVEAVFLDGANGFRRESVKFPPPPFEGANPKQIVLWGVVRRSQALREAKYHMNFISALSRVVRGRAALDAVTAQVGDVTLWQHHVPLWAFGGRVVSASLSDVVLTAGMVTGTMPEFDAAACVDGDPSTKAWRAEGGAVGNRMTVDLGAGNEKAFVRVRLFVDQDGCDETYEVRHSSDNFAADNVLAATFVPSKAGWNEATWAAAGAKRYWRIRKSVVGTAVRYVTEAEFYTAASVHKVVVDPPGPEPGGSLPTGGPASYRMAFRYSDDAFEDAVPVSSVSAVTTSPEGYPRQTVTLGARLAQTPTPRDALWLFGRTSAVGKRFRIATTGLAPDLTRTMVGYEYDGSIYDAAGLVLPARTPSVLQNPYAAPNPVRRLRMAERVVYDSAGQPASLVEVSWERPAYTSDAGPYGAARVFATIAKDADDDPTLLLQRATFAGVTEITAFTLGPFVQTIAAAGTAVIVWVQPVSTGGVPLPMERSTQAKLVLAKLWGNKAFVDHFVYQRLGADAIDPNKWLVTRTGSPPFVAQADNRILLTTGGAAGNEVLATGYRGLAPGNFGQARFEAKFRTSPWSPNLDFAVGFDRVAGDPGGGPWDAAAVKRGSAAGTVAFVVATAAGGSEVFDNLPYDPAGDRTYSIEADADGTRLYVDGTEVASSVLVVAKAASPRLRVKTLDATDRTLDVDYVSFIPIR